MDISKKTDYALRMIATLVENPEAVISVRTASKVNQIPYSFARTIQHDLSDAGIVESLRGAQGGMRLLVDPEHTTLLQVVEAIQGPLCVSSCEQEAGGGPCPKEDICTFAPIFRGARELLAGYLSSITLAEAVSGTGQGTGRLRSQDSVQAGDDRGRS